MYILNIARTILLASLLVISSSYAEFNLNQFRYGDYSFNRDSDLRYRGVGPELNLTQAIKAMLGHKESSMKSMLFDAVRIRLMGSSVPFSGLVSGYYSTFINTEIQEYIKDNSGNGYDYDKATSLARKIVNEDFERKYTDSEVVDHFVNYASYSYFDYPNDPREVIFSTVYMEIAANYSSNVAVLRDHKKFGIDLNYYNYKRNGVWIRKINPWPDKGEFVNAIEVPANDIIGYEVRGNFTKNFQVFTPATGNLTLGFYKTTFNGEDYIIILKGNGRDGIFVNGDDFYYSQSSINPIDNVPTQMTNTGVKAEAIAIIAACPVKDECHVPSKLFKKYDIKGDDYLRSQYLQAISAANFKNIQAKVFLKDPKDIEEDKDNNEDKDEAKKQTSKNDQLASVKTLAAQDMATDNLLNVVETTENYSIQGNELTYSFGTEKLFNPGDSIYFVIPEKFQDREIVKVELLHRKDDGASYAAFSTQFYSKNLGNWRISSTQGRKGRTGSPEGALALLVTPSNIDGFEAGRHKEFPYGSKDSNIIAPTAMRVISMGRDKNYISRITVEFK